jgi:hypothetical protein
MPRFIVNVSAMEVCHVPVVCVLLLSFIVCSLFCIIGVEKKYFDMPRFTVNVGVIEVCQVRVVCIPKMETAHAGTDIVWIFCYLLFLHAGQILPLQDPASPPHKHGQGCAQYDDWNCGSLSLSLPPSLPISLPLSVSLLSRSPPSLALSRSLSLSLALSRSLRVCVCTSRAQRV